MISKFPFQRVAKKAMLKLGSKIAMDQIRKLGRKSKQPSQKGGASDNESLEAAM